MGGVLAVLAAMHVPETDAAVSWYGIPPDNAGDPSAIQAPLQCHFGIHDAFFTIASADALEKKLQAGGVTHECYRYDAGHAFSNEEGPNYNRDAATLAWQRSLKFLDRWLRK
jgi:carboxymethylenebutenolidase